MSLKTLPNNPHNFQIVQGLGLPWRQVRFGGGLFLSILISSSAWAAGTPAASDAPATTSAPQTHAAPPASANEVHFFIREYRVKGGEHLLPNADIEEAVYPYLGPYRTIGDVEHARQALEKVYQAKGFQTVSVIIPVQKGTGGIISLQVVPKEVGRLRVKGSRYYSPDEIRDEAPSLAEGKVPDYNAVLRDLATLNQFPDRHVTAVPVEGRLPGTIDYELDVKDTMPLHGSLEINNRYSADTTPLRINGSIDYDNLWQMGHTLGASFQVAPENPDDVKVFSGFYMAHVPTMDWLTLMLQGTKNNSNVNTLTGTATAGKGETVGVRAIMTLPSQKDFYHSLSLGIDYKRNEQTTLTAAIQGGALNNSSVAQTLNFTPIVYYPLSASYSGTWLGKGYETDLNGSATFDLRGTGSSDNQFETDRHGSKSDFFYFRGDVSHTRDLPGDLQIFGKVQGQASEEPLINTEQFSGGGLGTVRGYLESEDLGDNAIFASTELRSPSLGGVLGKSVDDWRFYLFGEGGYLTLNDPLLEQQDHFSLASVGGGTRIKIFDHFNGSFDAGVPLLPGTTTQRYAVLLTFRIWAEF